MRRVKCALIDAAVSIPRIIPCQLHDDNDEAEQQQVAAPAHRDVVVKACPIEHEVRTCLDSID